MLPKPEVVALVIHFKGKSVNLRILHLVVNLVVAFNATSSPVRNCLADCPKVYSIPTGTNIEPEPSGRFCYTLS